MADVEMLPTNRGAQGSKVFKIGQAAAAGYATGGTGGAILGGLSTAAANSDSGGALSALLNSVKKGDTNAVAETPGTAVSAPTLDPNHDFTYDPIQSRMDAAPIHPSQYEAIVNKAVEALSHPDVPPHIAQAMAPTVFALRTHGLNGLPADHLFDNQSTDTSNESGSE